MNTLNQLIIESTQSSSVSTGRPALVGLTKAKNSKIFTDLVAVQESSQPQATVFGVRYLNAEGVASFNTPAIYGGKQYPIAKDIGTGDTDLNKNDYFTFNKVVYQALEAIDINLEGGSSLAEKLFIAVMHSKVRIVTEGADANDTDQDIAETNLSIDRWQVDVKSRKLVSKLSHELVEDLGANGFNADSVVEDLLSSEISEEVNKDIIKTLQTVSLRHNSVLVNKGIADLTTASDDPALARTMYRIVSEMATAVQRDTSYRATYVLCSADVAGLLASSGWMSPAPSSPLAEGVLRNGLLVYIDSTTQFNYVVVGMKHQTIVDKEISSETLERVGSLFYSPYAVNGVGASIFVTNNPKNMQPQVMAMTRYGLSVNPYTAVSPLVLGERPVHMGDDWANLAGKSKYSRFAGVFI